MKTPSVNIAIDREIHYALKLISVQRREDSFQAFLNKVLDDWVKKYKDKCHVPGQTAQLPVSDLVDQR